MIGKLKGLVDGIYDDHVIVDVNGVGYVVQCSGGTLAKLPVAGAPVSLAIETQVREDAIRLFGFLDDADREWFRLLQTVQGVGSKVALGIQSVLARGEIATAIGMQDKAMIARAPGVGPKLAARIVSELKDKAPGLGSLDGLAVHVSGAGEAPVSTAAKEAVSALVNLGYQQSQASAAVAAAIRQAGADADTGQLVRLALKEMAR